MTAYYVRLDYLYHLLDIYEEIQRVENTAERKLKVLDMCVSLRIPHVDRERLTFSDYWKRYRRNSDICDFAGQD
jgi:hypothetical protein